MGSTVNFASVKVLFLVGLLLGCALISLATVQVVSAQSSYQTWGLTVETSSGSHSGTLYVDSDGSFTSSGFTGSTSSGSYPIYISGYMDGDSITFTMTASYDGDRGHISGNGHGTLNADFPAATYGSGTVSGTISDPLGTRGFNMEWTATKTSGGSGSSNFGGSPFSYTIAAIVGVVMIIIIVGAVTTANKNNKARQARRQQQGIVAPGTLHSGPVFRNSNPTNPRFEQVIPPTIQGEPMPPPITMDNGVPITGQGVSVAPVSLGELPFLNANWYPGRARLTWGTPQFDPSQYVLLGYDISQQTYGPMSTAAQNVRLGRVPAGTNQTNVAFNQTYRWNTSGDIGGFRVDPVFGQILPSGEISAPFHHGGLGVGAGQSFGTYGVGP